MQKKKYQKKAEIIMKKRNNLLTIMLILLVCAVMLTGCIGNHSSEEKQEPATTQVIDNPVEEETESSAETIDVTPEIVEADWSNYFNGLNGTAVVYDATNQQYTIYNRDLAVTESSPCSTFKIISSLIALENGIIEPENSTRTWSGEIFWNEDWNKDIDFPEAFRTSCVWYYRQVIDDIGQDLMKRELDRLQYGNCDISDWEGRLNTNNSNRALTGFWIESSLLISPVEQVEVMERIFGDNSAYSEETQAELKQVMLLPEIDGTDITIYGKTGMGKPMVLLLTHGLQVLRKAQQEKYIFACVLGEATE